MRTRLEKDRVVDSIKASVIDRQDLYRYLVGIVSILALAIALFVFLDWSEEAFTAFIVIYAILSPVFYFLIPNTYTIKIEEDGIAFIKKKSSGLANQLTLHKWDEIEDIYSPDKRSVIRLYLKSGKVVLISFNNRYEYDLFSVFLFSLLKKGEPEIIGAKLAELKRSGHVRSK